MNLMSVITVPGPRAYPPRVTHFNASFWQSLEEGKLTTTCCNKCGEATFPPKPICPRCWALNPSWKVLSPLGVIYSYTVVHAPPSVFAAEAPYAVGIVDLDEGLRVALRLVGAPERLAVGMRGTVVTLKYNDGPYFAFLADA